ncbi:uncharacterized protein TNCV_4787141 [Trichonephila clavipes]|nr:uncharacterized protein TNCV_4787141 [Trichonephila clavipes]
MIGAIFYDFERQHIELFYVKLLLLYKRNNLLQVLAASTARFLQFQRYAATLCQFLILRVFMSCSTSSNIHLVGGLPLVRDPIGFLKCVSSGLVVFRASPDVAEASQSITSDDLSNLRFFVKPI